MLLENVKDVEVVKDKKGTPWYYLHGIPAEVLEPRLKELQALHEETQAKQFTLRMGQALELAVSKALLSQKHFHTLGHFTDMKDHDDSTLYKKEEPPSNISGKTCEGKLDFVLFSGTAGLAGVESNQSLLLSTAPATTPASAAAGCGSLVGLMLLIDQAEDRRDENRQRKEERFHLQVLHDLRRDRLIFEDQTQDSKRQHHCALQTREHHHAGLEQDE